MKCPECKGEMESGIIWLGIKTQAASVLVPSTAEIANWSSVMSVIAGCLGDLTARLRLGDSVALIPGSSDHRRCQRFDQGHSIGSKNRSRLY